MCPQVAAYAAARMPGCYAAVARVLDELRLRLPDFTPRSMLDFGAGPGTAIWAAREARLLLRCRACSYMHDGTAWEMLGHSSRAQHARSLL